MAELTTLLKKSRPELQFRMVFVEKFPLEENYATAVAEFSSWTDLRESFSGKVYGSTNHGGTDDWLTPLDLIHRINPDP
jgi:hypothetical protein